MGILNFTLFLSRVKITDLHNSQWVIKSVEKINDDEINYIVTKYMTI